MKRYPVLFILICMALGSSAMNGVLAPVGWAAEASGVSVSALVDRRHIQPGESVRLRVVVNGGDGVVDLAPLTDFDIHSQGTATQISMINMKTTRQVTHTYQLIPRRTGTLTIPALTVDVDGNLLRTEPLKITVQIQTAADGGAREIFVTADVSHRQPYVGQQIRYTFSLYQGVQITDGRLEQPDFEGFEVHEYEERPTRRKVVDGREYLITEVHYLLIPLAPGQATIGPSRLSFGLVKRQQRSRSSRLDDFFGFGRSQVEPRLLTSESLELTIRPLPAHKGAPPFSGLVGEFELSREVAQTALKVGESTTVAARISGTGNIRDAQMPPLEVPPSFKAYDDTPTVDIRMDGRGYSGEKVFRTALVPVAVGTFQLPASRLVYFDPVQESYREVRAPAVELAVTAGDPGTDTTVAVMANPQAGQSAGVLKEKVAYTGMDLLPLKEDLDTLRPPRQLGQPLFWSLLLLPALAYVSLGGALRLLKPATDVRSRMRRRVRRALKEAGASDDSAVFLNALRRALVAAVMGAGNASGAALTATEMRQVLEHSGAGEKVAAAAAHLLEEIDGFHYSGAALGDEAREDLHQRTTGLTRQVLK